MELLSLDNLFKYLKSCLRLEGWLKIDVRTTVYKAHNNSKKHSQPHVLPYTLVCFSYLIHDKLTMKNIEGLRE